MTQRKNQHTRPLDDLLANYDRLTQELSESMSVREFWPEAFNAGGCKVRIHSGFNSSGFVFSICRGDGHTKEWPIEEVPHGLLRANIARAHINFTDPENAPLRLALYKIGYYREEGLTDENK